MGLTQRGKADLRALFREYMTSDDDVLGRDDINNLVGSLSAGLIGGLACQAAAGRGRCDSGAFLAAGVGGGIAGAVYGVRAANRVTEEVIYRAP